MDYLSDDDDFNALSLLNLLEARDLYHVHLMHYDNVIATAVGRYLIRKTDPWPQFNARQPSSHATNERQRVKNRRTLENSEVRPYSWPCILVLVQTWIPEDAFGHQVNPKQAIPKSLYLPNSQIVPICVVEASLDTSAEMRPDNLTFAKNLIGGGYPVLADVQQQEHIASIECMVTDGHLVYALTNRHVSGVPREPIYSLLGGQKIQIGVSAGGILAHYVGDSCQPLHISYLFNGDPNDTVPVEQTNRHTGETETVQVPRAAGVHSAYEDDMVDYHVAEIMNGLRTSISQNGSLPLVNDGHAAAVAIVQLMQNAFDTISPHQIIEVFNSVKQQTKSQVADALWASFGDETIKVIADGSHYLAMLWDSAWAAGDGRTTISDLSMIDSDALKQCYVDKNFLPSLELNQIGTVLI